MVNGEKFHFFTTLSKEKYFSSIPTNRKIAAGLSITLHMAFLAVVLMKHQQSVARPLPGITLINLSLNARPSHPATTHPLAQTPPMPPRINLMSIVKMNQSTVDALHPPNPDAAVGGPCDLTDPVQAALRTNGQVLQQISAIPADRRSVANAIALWNEVWVPIDNTTSQNTITPIRDTVVRVVQAATEDCRNQVQAGPRLIYLPDASGQTVIFALGSGQWTWQQVAQTSAVQSLPAQSSLNQPLPAQAFKAGDVRTELPIGASLPSLSWRPDYLKLPAMRKSRS